VHNPYAEEARLEAEGEGISTAYVDEGEPEDDLLMNEGGEALAMPVR
jgi:hypothetical protein